MKKMLSVITVLGFLSPTLAAAEEVVKAPSSGGFDIVGFGVGSSDNGGDGPGNGQRSPNLALLALDGISH